MRRFICLAVIFCFGCTVQSQNSHFIKTNGHQFILDDIAYHYIGANYWYAGILANEPGGKARLIRELDLLKRKGVNNLRIMGAVEGVGRINDELRVEHSLQPAAGIFNESEMSGLDFLLAEMSKRQMKAVIFLSNNWEWSGGFLQYLNWNGLLADSVLKRKLGWDEMRDIISEFYSCELCKLQYAAQVKLIIERRNLVSGIKYMNDPTIMSWEIANEPRPMRPAAIEKYKQWIAQTAATIHKLDPNHLVTTGSEGEIGSENMNVFRDVHADNNIDYATIHIWPKNWGWFKDTSISKDMDLLSKNTVDYIDKHIPVLRAINKPLVIEEFGLPRDFAAFKPGTSTRFRDIYYEMIFKKLLASIETNDVIAGANFWAYSGVGRAAENQVFWKKGDDLLGDPPMEEQGLNSVFDSDTSTWKIIEVYSKKINSFRAKNKTSK